MTLNNSNYRAGDILHDCRSLPLSEWTANAVYTRLWSLGPLATRLVQQDSTWEFWVVTRYVSALGWVRVQVLLVYSLVVSAWPLVSRAGHDGVLGCPVC